MSKKTSLAIKVLLLLAVLGFIGYRAITVAPQPETPAPAPTIRLANGSNLSVALKPEAKLPSTNSSTEAMEFSPDGQLLARAHRGGIELWDMNSGELLREFGPAVDRPNFVIAIMFSNDGSRLAAGYWDATARVWDVPTGREIAMFQGTALRVEKGVEGRSEDWQPIAFSPDGQRLITALEDEDVTIWDIAAQRRITVLKGQPNHPVYCIALSPDGKLLATGGDIRSEFTVEQIGDREFRRFTYKGPGELRIWNMPGDTDVEAITDFEDAAHAIIPRAHKGFMAFSPDGKWLAKSYLDARRRETGIGQWDTEEYKLRAKLKYSLQAPPRYPGTIFTPARIMFSHDGQRLLAIGSEFTPGFTFPGVIRVWDLGNYTHLAEINFPNTMNLAVAPDLTRVAHSNLDHVMKMKGWSLVPTYPMKRWKMDFRLSNGK